MTTTSMPAMQALSTIPAEPAILAVNAYFWSAATSASYRRRNEERNQSAVANYLTSLGFVVARNGDNVIADKDSVHVHFYYSESCKKVYKSLSVSRDGKNSNITAIRKIAKNF